jgi:hypothetical protein
MPGVPGFQWVIIFVSSNDAGEMKKGLSWPTENPEGPYSNRANDPSMNEHPSTLQRKTYA